MKPSPRNNQDGSSRHASEYEATADELEAIDKSDQSGVASEEEVAAAFRTFRRTRKLNIRRGGRGAG
jgi:hypothetical protein